MLKPSWKGPSRPKIAGPKSSPPPKSQASTTRTQQAVGSAQDGHDAFSDIGVRGTQQLVHHGDPSAPGIVAAEEATTSQGPLTTSASSKIVQLLKGNVGAKNRRPSAEVAELPEVGMTSRQISPFSNESSPAATPTQSRMLHRPRRISAQLASVTARLKNIFGSPSSQCSQGSQETSLASSEVKANPDRHMIPANEVSITTSAMEPGVTCAPCNSTDFRTFVDCVLMTGEAWHNPVILHIRDRLLAEAWKAIEPKDRQEVKNRDLDSSPRENCREEWQIERQHLKLQVDLLQEQRQELETEVAGLRAQRDRLNDALEVASASQQKLQGVLHQNLTELQACREKLNQAKSELEVSQKETMKERERADEALNHADVAAAALARASEEAAQHEVASFTTSPQQQIRKWIEGVRANFAHESSNPSESSQVIDKQHEMLPGASVALLLANTAELCEAAGQEGQGSCAIFSKSWNILQSVGRVCNEIDADVQGFKISECEFVGAARDMLGLLTERHRGVRGEREALLKMASSAVESMARCWGICQGRGPPESKVKGVSRELQAYSKTCIVWAIDAIHFLENHWSDLQQKGKQAHSRMGSSGERDRRAKKHSPKFPNASKEQGQTRHRRYSDPALKVVAKRRSSDIADDTWAAICRKTLQGGKGSTSDGEQACSSSEGADELTRTMDSLPSVSSYACPKDSEALSLERLERFSSGRSSHRRDRKGHETVKQRQSDEKKDLEALGLEQLSKNCPRNHIERRSSDVVKTKGLEALSHTERRSSDVVKTKGLEALALEQLSKNCPAIASSHGERKSFDMGKTKDLEALGFGQLQAAVPNKSDRSKVADPARAKHTDDRPHVAERRSSDSSSIRGAEASVMEHLSRTCPAAAPAHTDRRASKGMDDLVLQQLSKSCAAMGQKKTEQGQKQKKNDASKKANAGDMRFWSEP